MRHARERDFVGDIQQIQADVAVMDDIECFLSVDALENMMKCLQSKDKHSICVKYCDKSKQVFMWTPASCQGEYFRFELEVICGNFHTSSTTTIRQLDFRSCGIYFVPNLPKTLNRHHSPAIKKKPVPFYRIPDNHMNRHMMKRVVYSGTLCNKLVYGEPPKSDDGNGFKKSQLLGLLLK